MKLMGETKSSSHDADKTCAQRGNYQCLCSGPTAWFLQRAKINATGRLENFALIWSRALSQFFWRRRSQPRWKKWICHLNSLKIDAFIVIQLAPFQRYLIGNSALEKQLSTGYAQLNSFETFFCIENSLHISLWLFMQGWKVEMWNWY